MINCCTGGEVYEDLVNKTCIFVISGVIKMDFCEFVVTSQGKQKQIAKGSENVAIEAHLSCDDSSYDESTMSASDGEVVVHSGISGKEDGNNRRARSVTLPVGNVCDRGLDRVQRRGRMESEQHQFGAQM